MNNKIEVIISNLSNLNLLEATELVKRIEILFGVTASAPIVGVSVSPIPAILTAIPEEKTEFQLFLDEVPSDKKIAVLKIVRTITGLGLKESKDLVDQAPRIIKEGMSKDSVELAKKQLEETGAKISIK